MKTRREWRICTFVQILIALHNFGHSASLYLQVRAPFPALLMHGVWIEELKTGPCSLYRCRLFVQTFGLEYQTYLGSLTIGSSTSRLYALFGYHLFKNTHVMATSYSGVYQWQVLVILRESIPGWREGHFTPGYANRFSPLVDFVVAGDLWTLLAIPVPHHWNQFSANPEDWCPVQGATGL